MVATIGHASDSFKTGPEVAPVSYLLSDESTFGWTVTNMGVRPATAGAGSTPSVS